MEVPPSHGTSHEFFCVLWFELQVLILMATVLETCLKQVLFIFPTPNFSSDNWLMIHTAVKDEIFCSLL